MLGSALSAGANVTIQKSLESRSEGRAVYSPLKTPDSRSLGTVRHLPSSPFQKIMLGKTAKAADAKKVAAKVTAQGDHIYGYLGYSTDMKTIGLYEFNAMSQDLMWKDPIAGQLGLSPSNLSLDGNVLKGYMVDIFWGTLYDVYYVEYDFATGEAIKCVRDESEQASFIQTAALDTQNGVFYGYGGYDGTYGMVSAPANDPFNYTFIADNENYCSSICYNPVDDTLYGINGEMQFVSIDKATGVQLSLIHISEPTRP